MQARSAGDTWKLETPGEAFAQPGVLCMYCSLRESSTYEASDCDSSEGMLFYEDFGSAGALAADIEAGGEVSGVNLHALKVVVYGLCVGIDGYISY